ncbi:MAG: DUF255 domain-containing protein [Bacteroidales bacterium]|nr:DUF255 domain-containing protein [Bacteroidales bacterium]MCF8387277.1 DUF255 domain-containing protein [Bacteroidales bacterium]MCF8396877.1 DUF255 domain-containing protein [Bacteroidales bacterium]
MKFKYTLLILVLLAGNVFAQKDKIKWYGFEEAIALSKENPKKIFVDVYTDWCGWCKKMDKSTFVHPVIVEHMNENYYPVKFDAESSDTIRFKEYTFVNPKPDARRSSHQLAQALLRGKMSYPSYTFLTEKGELIMVVPGYRKAPEFEKILQYFTSDAYKSKEWNAFASEFEGSIKSAE